jgi:aminobenzoyl-glutamate utilization protein B
MAAAQGLDGPKRKLVDWIDGQGEHFGALSRKIWETPELGFTEVRSSALIIEELKSRGFRVREGVAGMPTAFVAEWGSGKPVVAILGEYDALPGLSQGDVPEKRPVIAGGPGHGCEHNLLGTAAALAVAAVKEQMAASGKGTIRYYGTPAEEGGAGKVYMIRAGLFKDVDAVLAWHPWDGNAADDNTWLANVSAKVRFRGQAAHAAGAPEMGRSALDAVEVMTHAVNLMREHVPQETRMHYIITNGGSAANIVPDLAELSIIVRHPDQKMLASLWERVMNCAQAGALATGTRMEAETTGAYASFVTNPVLRDVLDRNLRLVGGVEYTAAEKQFAEALRKTLDRPSMPPLEDAAKIQPPKTALSSVSTDVGDVSWVVPTGHMLAATLPPGIPLHSWQSTAVGGTSLGRKGMMVAAKTLALSAAELLGDQAQVDASRQAWKDKLKGAEYRSLIPEGRTPPAAAH